MDRYGGVHSQLICTSRKLGLLPATRLASRKILIEQNIKNQTGPALCVLCGRTSRCVFFHQVFLHTIYTFRYYLHSHTLYVLLATYVLSSFAHLILSATYRLRSHKHYTFTYKLSSFTYTIFQLHTYYLPSHTIHFQLHTIFLHINYTFSYIHTIFLYTHYTSAICTYIIFLHIHSKLGTNSLVRYFVTVSSDR